MRKKIMATAAVLALLTGTPQAHADDDIIVFGGEFEEESPEETAAPFEEPTVEETPVEQPAEQTPSEDDSWNDELIFDDLSSEPAQKPAEQPIETQPIEEPPEQEPTFDQPFEQPITEPEPEEPPELPESQPPLKPAETPEVPAQIEPTSTVEPPEVEPTPTIEPPDVEPVTVVPPVPEFKPPQLKTQEQPARLPQTPKPAPADTDLPKAEPQKKLKMLKPRFVKLAVDDTYTYYLDKNSVQWKKMPYSSSEYIADVWIRMVERTAQPLTDDMLSYGEENFSAEIALAAEQGYQYQPDDLQVLAAQAYVLEHYYLRPKTNQIQFLCELEVFGRPQNTINERAYDYKNWENLVPGSVESVIYATVLKTIGKSKATERGHMTLVDMIEEYGRISLR